jgi:hypothetical protein
MFYCEKCRKKKNWPSSFFKSLGPCEICNKTAICYNMESGDLPLKNIKKKKRKK